MKTTTLTLTAILGMTAPAFAEVIVEDTDQSGGFSMAELAVAYPEMSEDLFAQIDADGSGEVSTDELIIARDVGLLGA